MHMHMYRMICEPYMSYTQTFGFALYVSSVHVCCWSIFQTPAFAKVRCSKVGKKRARHILHRSVAANCGILCLTRPPTCTVLPGSAECLTGSFGEPEAVPVAVAPGPELAGPRCWPSSPGQACADVLPEKQTCLTMVILSGLEWTPALPNCGVQDPRVMLFSFEDCILLTDLL